jgi:hypothetical protein
MSDLWWYLGGVYHVRVEHLSRVQEQINDLFRQYFLYLIRTLEVGIIDYRNF